MSDFIRHPFAATGEREAIPDSTQVDGSVSLQEGFGPEYSLDIRTEAEARSIERTKFNFLMYRVTSAIRWLQMFGVPEFITTADNGGTAFSYADGVRVRYNPGSGYKVYQSLTANNTALPTDATKWIEVHTASGVPNGTITNAQIKTDAAIDATKIGGGTVSNAVFGYLAGVSSAIQTQLNGKQASGNYLTALTGDVTAAGPGSSSATLANTGVAAGTYYNANVVVDSKGRIVSAQNGPNPISLLDSFETWNSGLPSTLPWSSGQAGQIVESSSHVTTGTKSVLFDATGAVTMSATVNAAVLAPMGEVVVDVFVGTIGPADFVRLSCGAESVTTPAGETGAFTLRCTVPDGATTISLHISDAGQCWLDNLRAVIEIYANGVSYNNGISGILATTVQGALDLFAAFMNRVAGFATAAQGAKADTALQPNGDGSGLSGVSRIYDPVVKASTSGTAVTFSGSDIPENVRRIKVFFTGVSVSGNSEILIRIGNNTVDVSSYLSALAVARHGSATSGTSSSAGFTGTIPGPSVSVYGEFTLTRVGANNWHMSPSGGYDGFIQGFSGFGYKALSGPLNILSVVTANGTDTFDAGSISLVCEV